MIIVEGEGVVDKVKELLNKFKESKLSFKVSLGIVLIVIAVIICLIFFGAPMNSVTIRVVDQHDKAIDGLEITLENEDNSYKINFSNGMTKSRALDVKKGKYSLRFSSIPYKYTCFTTSDNFKMKRNGKVKLEYECIKAE